MKNKLFVRGAVIVVALMLLVSTVAFADAVAPTFDAENCAIVFDGGYTSTEDQVTIMAFAVEKGKTAEEVAALADGTGVIAINQVAGSVGFTTVKINPDLFEEVVTEDKDIAVLVGGSNGEVKPFVLSTDAEVEEPTTYTASFAGDGVSIDAMTGNEEGATITLPAVPAKEGFTGVWNDGTTDYEGGATYTFGAADVTFTAVYTEVPATYTASFAGDGVSIDAMTGNAEGATITLPAVPAKEGFTGVWNDGTTDYEGGATYTFGAADVTFTAVYTEVPAEEDPIDFTYGDISGDGIVDKTDYNAIKVYESRGSHPKYTTIGTSAATGYVYGDISGDGIVDKTDYNAIKVYESRGSHPKYTTIGTTVKVQP